MSLANPKCDKYDVSHGQELTRRESDVMAMDGVSRRPRFFVQSEFSFKTLTNPKTAGTFPFLKIYGKIVMRKVFLANQKCEKSAVSRGQTVNPSGK